MKISLDVATRRQLYALVLLLIGAVAFSSKAILVKLAYRHQVDSVSLLALRMVFALPMYLLVSWLTRRTAGRVALSRADWGYMLLLGLLGYYVASLLDFWGLQYLSAGMERLILFMYPTLVLLFSAVFLHKRVSKWQYGAVALTYCGIAIAFAEAAYIQPGAQFWWGALLVFGCALGYALYVIGSGQLLPRVGTVRYTTITMGFAGVAILLHHGIFYHWALFHFSGQVYLLALLMALVGTVLPTFLIAEGIRLIGAGNAAIIGSVGPMSTIVLAYFILGESFGWWQWVGVVLVIGGVLLVSRAGAQA